MESLSFDPMAKLYDETRVFDEDCFDVALNFLTERFPPLYGRDLDQEGKNVTDRCRSGFWLRVA
jgi:hypothetical protein